ncbi:MULTISPECIES: hypothetical protein [unclassified Iodidimonas]|jgi:hypothetical protein|uniref:hypothetical protein n=1 Tax=unclassified Iodidimonas TaxID=2626145 RepID=UPI0024825D1C|nr:MULTISPECIES: hypothetical protein [unclassified Iodidimonas]
MAKKPTSPKKTKTGAKKASARGAGGKRYGGGGRLIAYMAFAGMLFTAPPIAALLIIGLLPTLVLLLADVTPERGIRLNAMFAFNLSGVLPYLVKMWEAGPSFVMLMEILTDLMAWTVMLGAAGAGAALLWVCPVITAGIQHYLNQGHAERLGEQRKAMIREWGEGVSSLEERPAET